MINRIIIVFISLAFMTSVHAAKSTTPVLGCSTSTGDATINEIQTTDNFIELYLRNDTDILNWSLYVDTSLVAVLGTGSCEINGTSAKDNSGTGTTSTFFPAGTFITCDYNVNPSSNEVLLVDKATSLSNGDAVVIDYIGYGNLTPSANWEVSSACGVLYPGHAANNKDIARIPDGTGALVDNGNDSTKGTTNVGNTGVDHYEIYHDGVGITCLAEPITIKACANADCSAVVATPLSVDLSIGSISETINLSTGQIAYDFNFSNTGTYPVTISNQSLAAPVSCYVNNQLSANCNIMFTDSLLSITVPTLTACKTAQATIQAIATDPNNQSCKAAISGNRTINFWSDYVNPTTGSRAVEIEGTAISTASPGTPINLHFSSDGQATFDVNYADAGQLSLSATFQAANGKSLSGTSDPFISKPVGLAVYTEEANAECITEDASCSAFKRAGETFDLKVNAACWTDDADTDFTDNPVTPNFELSNITATHALLAPVSGQLGSLSTVNVDFLLTDNGTHTLTQSVSEVGVFEFGISAPNYFGETLSTYASPAIGRFYPDHFKLTTLNEGDFNSACSGFTYSGQDVTYQTKPQLTITAYSTNPPDSITQNYTGDFAKLTATDVTVTPPTTDANQLGADNTNLVNLTWMPDSPTLIDHADGTLTFSFGDDSYRYLHELNSQIDQFTNAVNLTFTSLTDSDGVSAQALPYTLTPGGEVIRFGRLTIANAHGSELLPLSLTLTAEYFNGINWVDNAVDQCSVLNLATDIQLRNTQTAAGAWQTGTTVMTIGSGSTQASLTNNAPLSSGQATLTFSAPGEDNDGYVDIQSQLGSTAPWLLGDYDGDGVFDDEATGRASFGLFKGSDNIIFRREVF